MASRKTIAFFGATGGCAGTSLAHALREGYHCTALVRDPSKLTKILTEQHSIPSDTLTSHLTITTGDALSAASVAKALISPVSPTHLVDIIYTAIGAYPKFNLSLRTPFTLDNPTLCADGVRAIHTALADLTTSDVASMTVSGAKPVLVALSSTGVNGKTRDIPYAYYPLYHVLAAQPHADKREMERLVLEYDYNAGQLGGFVIIRPTALVDGKGVGWGQVRSGWEWGLESKGEDAKKEEAPGPAIGWMISRADVGEWVFKSVVEEGGWEGRCVSLTS